MNKFKVGDIVECIEIETRNPNIYGGCGWKKGLRFKITRISGSSEPIYWKALYDGGVYEP